MKSTSDTKLKWFQIRIIYRLIPTNRFLYIRKIIDNPSCSFGCGEEETIEHLFFDCPTVQLFWTDLLLWIRSNCCHCENFLFTEELVVLGRKNKTITDKVMDLIILSAKWHIYKCKLQNTYPHLNAFKNILRNRYIIEKYNSAMQCNITKFSMMWRMYQPLI